MTPKTVLFAIQSLDLHGPGRVMYELLCALDRKKFAPSLLVSEPTGHYLSRLPADVRVIALGTQTSLWSRYPLVKALRAVRALKPDVVFATSRMTLTLGMIAPLFPRATRLVLRQANAFSTDFASLADAGGVSRIKHRLSRRLALETLRRADVVVCQSVDMRDDLARQLPSSDHLFAIGNPVDLVAVRRALATSAPVSLPGRPALISVGRLSAQKGFDLLLPAIAKLRLDHPDLHLTIVGDGPDRLALVAQASELGITDAVTFAGFSSTVLPMVNAADLFVLASRYEGFPNVALEALACGTPVVLTRCPGANGEIVIPGVNGRLADTVDVDVFASALDRAIRERDTYHRARIVETTERRYASEHIVEAYQRVFAGDPPDARD